MSATSNFFRNGKLLFLAEVIAFLNRENTYIYIARANFNRDSPKINFKIFSYSFWDIDLKLTSYVALCSRD